MEKNDNLLLGLLIRQTKHIELMNLVIKKVLEFLKKVEKTATKIKKTTAVAK